MSLTTNPDATNPSTHTIIPQFAPSETNESGNYELTVDHDWLSPSIKLGDTLFVDPNRVPHIGRKAVLRMKDGTIKVGIVYSHDGLVLGLTTCLIMHRGKLQRVIVYIDLEDIEAMHKVVGTRYPIHADDLAETLKAMEG